MSPPTQMKQPEFKTLTMPKAVASRSRGDNGVSKNDSNNNNATAALSNHSNTTTAKAAMSASNTAMLEAMRNVPKRSNQAVYQIVRSVSDIVKEVDPFYNEVFRKQLEGEQQLDNVLSRHLARFRSRRGPSTLSPSSVRMFVSHTRRPIPDIPGFVQLNVELKTVDSNESVKISDVLDKLDISFAGIEQIAPAHWDPSDPNAINSHGFIIPRCIDYISTVTLEVYIKDSQIIPSPAFGRLIGIHSGTFDEIRTAFFLYVRTHNLLSAQKHGIDCDVYLAALFKKPFISIDTLTEDLYTQIQPKNPVRISYVITREVQDSVFFQIDMRTPAPLDAMRRSFVRFYDLPSPVNVLNEKMCTIASFVREGAHKTAFYSLISEDVRSAFHQLQQMEMEYFENNSKNNRHYDSSFYPSLFFRNSKVMDEAVARYTNNIIKQRQFQVSLAIEKNYTADSLREDLRKWLSKSNTLNER